MCAWKSRLTARARASFRVVLSHCWPIAVTLSHVCLFLPPPPSLPLHSHLSAWCVITQFTNKSSQDVNLSLVNTLFIGSLERERTMGRIRSTWIGTCPILGLPYSIYLYLYVSASVSVFVCLFAFPFGVAAVKIHNTTLIRSNGMTLSATATDSANSAHFTAKRVSKVKPQTPYRHEPPRTEQIILIAVESIFFSTLPNRLLNDILCL